jgi:excisionase family DNA binding protein
MPPPYGFRIRNLSTRTTNAVKRNEVMKMVIQIDDTDLDRIAAKLATLLQGTIPAAGKQPDNIIMDVEELAGMLKVDKSWVYKQVQYKSIPHFHAGKYPRFKRKEIDSWIQEQSIPSTCPAYPKLKAKQ